MKKFTTIILLLALLPGCGQRDKRPAKMATNLDEASHLLADISGQPIRPYSTRDFGRDQNAQGRSVIVPDEEARETTFRVRQFLGPGLIAFVGCTRSLADDGPKGSEVVVAKGDSQFDILRVAQSDAVNYDMATEDLVKKLQEYDQKYGIDIFHAETDTIEFKLKDMPADVAGFCHDLYEFCPDIVDQGTGSVAELQKEISKSKEVFLWWD